MAICLLSARFPIWNAGMAALLRNLTGHEIQAVKQFVLSSGSLTCFVEAERLVCWDARIADSTAADALIGSIQAVVIVLRGEFMLLNTVIR